MFIRATSSTRVAVMVGIGVVAALATGFAGQWPYAALIGWDAAATVFGVWVWAIMIVMGPELTAAHATKEEPGRAQSDVIVVVASIASLAAVGYVLTRASAASGHDRDWLAALGVLSVGLSWFAVHTLFALRYARLYYGDPEGGIGFNQPSPPRYLDFAYLAFTIGMTFQVSDTDLKTSPIRATVLRQALVAYLFGAVILGAMINLIASLASRSG
jgi:uncharacterized membrane protein